MAAATSTSGGGGGGGSGGGVGCGGNGAVIFSEGAMIRLESVRNVMLSCRDTFGAVGGGASF